ncbi:TetR/AcrR family transcriptional regulator [Thermoactinospora rubra]|uniref:TetR/AcrR family transcriptional regulator n=1 Tax=Thermoactinospora rubra TaxID=1088767 RepID=UPI000A10ACDD|nr:TetR/AcrR family transcriptional regulator [Thermoactinospora rubra]
MTASQDRILDAATRLFAALGYDGTSIDLIAQTAGVSRQELARRYDGKQHLYLAVMERAYQAEMTALQAVLSTMSYGDAASFAASVHRLIDAYLAFAADNPHIHALWMHRWLSDALDIAELESRYVHPLYTATLAAFEPAATAGYIDAEIDREYLLHCMMWCVQGFGRSGAPGRDRARGGFCSPADTRRFSLTLHTMIHRTLRLPGDYQRRP